MKRLDPINPKGVVADAPTLNLRPALFKRRVDDELEEAASGVDGGVMSDVTGEVVAQLDTASGLSGFVSGVEAAGGAAASAGAATASVATVSTITTTASVASVGTLSGLAGGVALAAAAGGGGSSSGPTITPTKPVPPTNPYPGTDPEVLDLSGGGGGGGDGGGGGGGGSGGDGGDGGGGSGGDGGGVATDKQRETVAGTALPRLILNKSLVIDLGATDGPLDGTLFHTQQMDAAEFTRVLTYKNILNVNGTALNDQITGSDGDNVLDGGLGQDVIYGGGGLDDLRGNEGDGDWVLFKPLTRASGSGQYDDGVFLSLAAEEYKNESQTGEDFGDASGFENAVGSDGNDVLLGSTEDNMLDGAKGDDVLMGGDGNDSLFDGASGTRGNQLWGEAGEDAFHVGYAINPVTRAFYDAPVSQGISQSAGTSVLRDWDAGEDTLKVSGLGVAVVGGLMGEDGWDGHDVVDLSVGVTNLGAIHVAAGKGDNQIYGSSGTEYYWVGYQYLGSQQEVNVSVADQSMVDGKSAPTPSDSAVDILWTWDDQSASRDDLDVAAASVAVIGGLQDVDGWSGDDTVDLRSGVSNAGTVVVAAGAGNNMLYGSSGNDHFYGSSGEDGAYNQVWGGLGANEYHVGWTYNTGTLSRGAEANSRDILWDWNNDTDVLDVSASGVAVLGLLSGLTDWNADNTVDLSGDNVSNDGIIVIALGRGVDTLTGSQGIEHIYGGASTGTGNQLWGGDDADYFFTGFNYNPVTAAATNDVSGRVALGAGEVGLDVIRDWQNNADRLMVGAAGKVVIGGLYGEDGWDGDDTVKVTSDVDNQGVIVVAAGAGDNQIHGSSGSDEYWVGYEYLPSTDVIDGAVSPDESAAATDNIWLWDDQSARRDSLFVASAGIAQIAGLQGVTGWAGDDTVDLRNQVTNLGLIRVAAGAGDNTLYGSSGNDEFNVGSEVSTATKLMVTSSESALDFIYGWNARDWAGSTWDADANWNGQLDGEDASYDRLNVADGSRAFMASLSGMDVNDAGRWAGAQTVDLRSSVDNDGEIVVWTGAGNDIVYGSSGRELIYGGSGLDNLYGGDGDDLFYVGSSPPYAPGGADNAETRIWDWQNGTSDAAPGDGLRISSSSFAVIAGLYGMDPQNVDRWEGADTVDLRWDVRNLGKIIVETSTGDDIIWGSSGVDYLLGGDGRNTYNLATGGADRVYIDSYVGQQQITGFGTDDKIYLDSRILDTFRVSKDIKTIDGYDVMLSIGKTDAGLGVGAEYRNGDFTLSEKTYDAAYNRTLGSFSGAPSTASFSAFGDTFGWQSDGAWNNAAYARAHDMARTALIAASSASLAVGYGLMAIPFVGPLLAIAPLTIGGLMLNDALNNLRAHQNATHGGVLDGGVNLLNSNGPSGSVDDVGVWNDSKFLSFYQKPSDKFVQSLEITDQQGGLPGQQVGVASYVTVYNGTETFIYLVFSRDGLIQDNETRLIAQVNGQVTADQLVVFDGATDVDYQRYFQNSVEAPVFAPNVSDVGYAASEATKVLYSVSYTQGGTDLTEFVDGDGLDDLLLPSANVTNLLVLEVLTNDSTPTLTFTLDSDLKTTDVVDLYLNGSEIATKQWTGLTASSVTYAFDSALADGVLGYTLKVTNAQKFETQYSGNLTVDTTPPDITNIVISDLESSLFVMSNEPGSAALFDGETLVGTAVALTDDNSRQGLISLAAQSSVQTLTLKVQDIFGQSTTVNASVVLGTDSVVAIDTIDKSGATSANYIYGFGGADVITAGNHGDVIYGGAGEDSITAGSGADRIIGGAGADAIVLPAAGGSRVAKTLIYSVDAAGGTSDSNSTARDTVTGFDHSNDVIFVVATGVESFDSTTDVVVNTGASPYIGKLNFNGDSDYTDLGDLQIDFGTLAITADQLKGALQYDLTGNDSDNTLAGGAWADRLTGGEGADTFIVAAGDSTPVISGSVVSGFDVITDMTLLDAVTGTQLHDTLDLEGAAVIAADTEGDDGDDVGDIMSHAITNGKITFFATDSFASPVAVRDDNLADVLGYLQSNITGDHHAVVFEAGLNSYVFQNNETGSDLLIQLAGTTGIEGLSTNAAMASAANYLFIV
jgi:Ca2+-binding RTX toxin-like protein